MEGSNEAPHDIENPYIRILSSMSSELDGLLPLSNSCCIYRVPEELRRVNEKAYTPQVVSIGPLHHGSKGLKDMEEHKKRYLQYFLKRTGVSLEDCVKKIKDREAELRSCYAQTIELSSDEFVRIILVDAAFIIELLLRFCFPIQLESNDRIFNKPWLIKFIIPDMLLLENQLPFFILEDLFATGEVLATMPSVFVLSSIFCMVSTSLYVKIDDSGSFSSFEVEHFVDLIRTLHLPTEEENLQNQRPFETLPVPSMTKLHQAGVKFKARSSNNLFDICFRGRSLEIPNLLIQDDTELLLRNLVAFEQCHCDCTYFSDYIFLMDYLVNTPNDVELLVKNGIVENLLGDNNEVSALINSLRKRCWGVQTKILLCHSYKGPQLLLRKEPIDTLEKMEGELEDHMEGKTETNLFRHTLENYFCNCCYCDHHTHCHTNGVFFFPMRSLSINAKLGTP